MKYGLIGKDLIHSKSSLLHQELGNFCYELKSLSRCEIEPFLAKRDFIGINVTIPYKQLVFSYLDEKSEISQATNVVNVITNQNNKLIGYNTDYYGFMHLLRKNHIMIKNKICAVLGSGATSKTIAYALNKLSAKETIYVSRNKKENCFTYDEIIKRKDIEIIINTTPRGMYPNNEEEPLLDINDFPLLEVVIDVIYNPINTKLVLKGKERNIIALGGLDMFIYQGLYTDKIFFHKRKIRNCDLLRLYLKFYNIVLIGLPYSGKSELALLLSKKLNLASIDLDKEIELREKMTIKEIFKNKGETYFRELEHAIIKEKSLLQGTIISTGGGCVENKENIFLLKQNSIIIYTVRDISLVEIKDDSRPLVTSKEDLLSLFKKRESLYKTYADMEINNNNLLDAVTMIIKNLKYMWR